MPESHPTSRAKRGGSARPLTGATPHLKVPERSPADPESTRAYPPAPGASRAPVTARSNGSARALESTAGETPTTVQPRVARETTTRPQRIAAGATPTRALPTPDSRAPIAAAPVSAAPVSEAPRRRRTSRRKRVGLIALLVVVVMLGWLVGLGVWANSNLTRADVLTGAEPTPGTTYLLAGSDSRGDGLIEGDLTTGQRADTLMLVHVADNGHSTLVSLPRDTLVDIPGHGTNKLNAAYAFGGSKLLVQTVEGLTGLTVDHYVEVGFAGVENIVNAVGTVNVCLPQDVNDPEARLNLTAGCHDVDGTTALAFVRVRHFDPTADLGRQARQREFMKSLTASVIEPATFVNPLQQASLAKAVTGSITVDEGTNIFNLAQLGLAFRSATGPDGTIGQIPWINPNYSSSVGSAIQIDPAAVKSYFKSVQDGTVPPSAPSQ